MTDRQRALQTLVRIRQATAAWIFGGIVIAGLCAQISWLWRFPTIGIFLIAAWGAFVGLKGLEGYWRTSSAYDFYARGYRARWLHSREYVYEEFGDDDMLRSLGFRYVRRVAGYAPPHRIALPTEGQWSQMTPAWAHGRRTEIVDRLIGWAPWGKDPDPRVSVVPLDSLEAE